MTQVGLTRELRDRYDSYYTDGESEWRRIGALDKADNIVALCGDLPHESLIEIGAGEGSILARLSELGFGKGLYGIDVSESGIQVIRARQIARLVECRSYDGYRVPYEDKSFDIAILSHVVEHLEHPRILLYEAARVARYVFIEVPCEDTVRLSYNYAPDGVGHINFYSPKTIRRLLQSSNLIVLSQLVNNPSRATYLYQKGWRGVVDYYIKQTLIGVWPHLATRLFTYHAAFVCEPMRTTGAV